MAKVGRTLRNIVGTALIGVGALEAACATTIKHPVSDSASQSTQKLYDLRGIWEPEEYHSPTTFQVKQEGNKIEVYTTRDTKYKRRDSLIFYGEVNGSKISGYYDVSPDGWRLLKGEISDDGNYIKTSTNWSGGVGILNIRRKNQ